MSRSPRFESSIMTSRRIPKSTAYRAIGPNVNILFQFSVSSLLGKCPSQEIAQGVGLCPQTPQHPGGYLNEPPTSEPIPISDEAEPSNAAYGETLVTTWTQTEVTNWQYFPTRRPSDGSPGVVRIAGESGDFIRCLPVHAKLRGVRHCQNDPARSSHPLHHEGILRRSRSIARHVGVVAHSLHGYAFFDSYGNSE